jgi:hypothetical protein
MNSFGLHYQGKDRFVVVKKSKRIRNLWSFKKRIPNKVELLKEPKQL